MPDKRIDELSSRTAQPTDLLLIEDPTSQLFYKSTAADFMSAGAGVTSVAGRTGAVVLTAADVGLGNVDNTSDVNKPVSTAQAASIATKEPTITSGTSAQYYRGDKTMQTLNQDAVPDGTTNKAYTATEKTKLSAIATAATANSSDATLLNRSNHTGTQTASTISDFSTAADARITAATGVSVEAHDTDLTTIAAIAPTNDDVIQRKAGAWTNRSMAQVKTDLALVKGDVGLGNVDNTSDATKNAAVATLTNKDVTSGTNTFPTFNQNTTGSAATLTTARTIGTLTGDVTTAGSTFNGSANNTNATVVGKINGVALSGLATGILKNTTTTGVPSIAVAADFPTLNQSTTGSAASFTGSLAGDVTGTQGATTVGKINGTSLAGLTTGLLKNTTTTGVPSIATAGTDYLTPSGNGSALTGITESQVTNLTTDLAAKQPLDSDLTTIAGLTATTDTFLQSKASAWTTRTPTQVTADLIPFVGDAGSGGAKGLVPAPVTGDSGKFLKGNGVWTSIPGGGDMLAATYDPAAIAQQVIGTTATQTMTNKTLTTPTLTTPVLNGTPTGTGIATAATANTLALRDANGNSAMANLLEGYTTTATAAGTTVLTVASNQQQFFTGSTTQIVTLPVASTLSLGYDFVFTNTSTGAVTINASGGGAVLVMAGGTTAVITCILTSGTTAASWSAAYFADVVATGKKLSVSNTLTLAGTDSTTMTFPSTSATIARTDAANTFTGVQTLSSAPVLSTGTLTSVAATMTFPASADTLVGRASTDTITGVKTFGAAGNVGKLLIAGTTSGTTTLNASAAASGTLTLPAATDTLVGKATTDTLTNKTLTAPVVDQFGTASGLGAAWTTYTPTQTGWVSTTILTGRWFQIGKMVTVIFDVSGTSNATTATLTVPVAAANTANIIFGAPLELTTDNGTNPTSPGKSFLNAPTSTTVMSLFKDVTGSVWTASGTKAARGTITYEAA